MKKETNKLSKFIIRYGMSAGYNDDHNYEILEASDIKEAEYHAYIRATETFQSYDEPDEDMDDWIVHEAYPYTEEKYNEIIEKYGKQAFDN